MSERDAHPEPPADPFRCSICGEPLPSRKRVGGEELCDRCGERGDRGE